MAAVKETGYTPEQLGNADNLAQLLKGEPEKNQSIIALLGNAFISGLEVGICFPSKSETAG